MPSGSKSIPIVEIRKRVANGEADGAFDFTYSGGTFTYKASYGSSNETISGRVCILGLGQTTEGNTAFGTANNGSSVVLSPTLLTTPFHKQEAPLGFVWSYWSGTDDDFAFSSTWSTTSTTLTGSIGNSGSWVKGAMARLSLPNGIKVSRQSFKVWSGNNFTQNVTGFFDDSTLLINEFFVSVLGYETCGADYLGYNVTCSSSSCTVTASNPDNCSAITGYITQLQWVDNQ